MEDKVKAKIQELVPSKLWRYTCDHCPCGLIIEESPSLAVVWRAYEQNVKPNNWGYDAFKEGVWQIIVYWDLKHDNYDQQSEETRAFIGSLLGVN